MSTRRRIPEIPLPQLILPLCLFFSVHSFGSPVGYLLETMPDRAIPKTILSNGLLGVGLDESGSLVSLVWPGTGGIEQTGVIERDGYGIAGHWGIDFGGGISWLDSPDWEVDHTNTDPAGRFTVTESRHRELGVEAGQWCLTKKTKNGVWFGLEIRGASKVPRVYWQCAVVPGTGHVPGVPLAGPLFPASAGFAGFPSDDGEVLYTFRPGHVSSSDWERARRMAAQGSGESAWDVFGGGTWVAMGSSLVRRAVFTADTAEQGSRVSLAKEPMLLELRPLGESKLCRAGIGISFADGREKARSSVGLLGADVWDPLEFANAMTEKDRSLRLLHQSLDSASGMVVALPCGRPPLAFSWPVLGAWAALAFSLNGAHDQAERQLEALLGAVNPEDAPDVPAGSIAPLLRTDGTPAFPAGVFNSADTAWVLLALRDVTAPWPKETRKGFAARHWAKIETMADFLLRWSDMATGRPIPGFDWERRRDASTFEMLLLHLLASGAAEDLAALSGRETPPEWTDWKRGLDAQVRFALANQRDETPLTTALGGWLALHPDVALPPLFRGNVMAGQAVPFESVVELRRIMIGYLRGIKGRNALDAAFGAVFSGMAEPE